MTSEQGLVERLLAHADEPMGHWEDWQNTADALMREAAAQIAASPLAQND